MTTKRMPAPVAALYPDAHVGEQDELRPARVPSRLHPAPEIPMPVDPDPHVPDLLLAAAAKLGWIPSSTDRQTGETLGYLDGSRGAGVLITVRGSAPGTIAWQVVADPPRRLPVYLMTRATFDVLATGQADGKGGVVCAGVVYRLAMESDGVNNIAVARAVGG